MFCVCLMSIYQILSRNLKKIRLFDYRLAEFVWTCVVSRSRGIFIENFIETFKEFFIVRKFREILHCNQLVRISVNTNFTQGPLSFIDQSKCILIRDGFEDRMFEANSKAKAGWPTRGQWTRPRPDNLEVKSSPKQSIHSQVTWSEK